MDALKGPAAITDYSLEQFRLLPVNARCVIVTYIATVRSRLQGKEEATRAYRSSTWIEQAGSWRMIFHQATPMAKDTISSPANNPSSSNITAAPPSRENTQPRRTESCLTS